ncbi:hypothetical protein GMRT_14047 [Giardia muris]|uniref:Uncharacterized protein n=1 Tax=Giardia muris TaxID=5742 RepID=A0A4Z1SN68_GIAMU|nr:hypothetical protein GMRT_14047 [Giardia muris]|eukprot:TNJ27194.1 hypothetical protein GMRT_14047 [Giardia muris]
MSQYQLSSCRGLAASQSIQASLRTPQPGYPHKPGQEEDVREGPEMRPGWSERSGLIIPSSFTICARIPVSPVIIFRVVMLDVSLVVLVSILQARHPSSSHIRSDWLLHLQDSGTCTEGQIVGYATILFTSP